jgi:hypothetical protein
MEELTEIMVLLIKGKYETAVPLTEDEFLDSLANKSKKQCV